MTQALDGLYEGLQAIWNTEFPKTCPKCGQYYTSIEDYFSRTKPLGGSTGLMEIETPDHCEQVGLFRNCPCGSTLMAFCRDRRDDSADGERRRELFDQLLERLTEGGLPTEEARARLRQTLRSGDASRLVALWHQDGI